MSSRVAAVAVLTFFSLVSPVSHDGTSLMSGRILASDSSASDTDRDTLGKENRPAESAASARSRNADATEADAKEADADVKADDKPETPASERKTPRRSTAAGKHWERKSLPTTDAEWRRVLTVPQYQVLRRHATEPAFSGRYWNTKIKGVYRCAGCGQPVFSSATKFNSGTGWPSYWAPYSEDSIGTQLENTAVPRVEVHCKKCGGHLGHVFSDGPQPTGLRFCINSVCLVLDRELPLVPESKPRAEGEAGSSVSAEQP